MIILVGGEKGGTGKSTIASNLAVWFARQGREVLMLDADPQGTSAAWTAERAEAGHHPAIHCVQRSGNVAPILGDLRTHYENIIVDAGGRDSKELRSAMLMADILLTPVRASQSDLWTIEHLTEVVEMARSMNPGLVAKVVISIAPTNPRILETRDAIAMLDGLQGMQAAACVLRDRKAYRDAMCEGKGVLELADKKAIAEIEQLAEELKHGKIQKSAGQAA